MATYARPAALYVPSQPIIGSLAGRSPDCSQRVCASGRTYSTELSLRSGAFPIEAKLSTQPRRPRPAPRTAGLRQIPPFERGGDGGGSGCNARVIQKGHRLSRGRVVRPREGISRGRPIGQITATAVQLFGFSSGLCPRVPHRGRLSNGSLLTRPWREPDSNHRSRVRKSGRCQVPAIRPGSVEY
jgi:hypothetical protein